MAVTHGAQSDRIVSAKSELLSTEVIAECPWLASPVFAESLNRYARCTVRAVLLTDHIIGEVEAGNIGRLGSRIWESAAGADNAAGKAAEQLGLTPLSQAKLRSLIASTEHTSADLDRLRETGAAIRARRAAELEPETEGE